MKFVLLYSEKNKENFIEEGVIYYVSKIKKYVNFDIKHIAIPDKYSKLPKNEYLKIESQKYIDKINVNNYIVLLDENGEKFDSRTFADFIQKLMNSSHKEVVFVLGGPFGFSDELYKISSKKISLSPLTFTHQLARLVFVEQFYRALTILNNEPYHH